MQVTHPNLISIINQLGRARRSCAWALAHNFRFDGRTDGARGDAYQADYPPPAATPKALRMSHAAYLRECIDVPAWEIPETFRPINTAALISSLGDQKLVRVESLKGVLDWTDPATGAFLTCFEKVRVHSMPPGHPDRVVAEAGMRKIVARMNRRRYARPMFATFLDCVQEEVDADDWPHLLRNRLGLGHFNPAGQSEGTPVALMLYTVGEVLAACPAEERASAFAVPTALDGPLNPYFFPAPTELGYGRTVDLAKDESCDRLVSEILHRRIEYKAENLYKVGIITRPIPEIPLRELRNTHLLCVQLQSGRDDFGEEIPAHVRG